MMVISSKPGVSGTAPSVEIGCGRLHTSMLDWQKCPQCATLKMYEAYARSPRFVEPPPPPKPKVDQA